MSAANIPSISTTTLANTGVPAVQWHLSDHHGHAVQFYSDTVFLLDALSKFVGTALGAGDAAVVIATREHRDGFSRQLSARGFDLAQAGRLGRYIALDAAETLSKFMVNGSPDAARFVATVAPVIDRASGAGTRRVAAYGEMVALLTAEGQIDAAIRLEQLWNDLSRTHSFHLRCAYPMKDFGHTERRDAFHKICAEHSSIIPTESYSNLGTDGERLRNIAQLQQKAEALATEQNLNEALQRAYQALEKEFAERREAQRKLRESETSLRQLSAHLLRTQDEERRRLGRELHDTIGQYLAALKMGLNAVQRKNGLKNEATEQMAECVGLVEQSIKEVRTMSYLLYPPMLEEAGLETATLWYLDGFAKRSGVRISFDMPPDFGRLSPESELAIFRVLQESLTNVHRHSESPTAKVRLFLQEKTAHLEVCDNGKGVPAKVLESFDSASGPMGVGLRGMRERARHLGGELEIASSGEGTTVRFSIPIEIPSPTDTSF